MVFFETLVKWSEASTIHGVVYAVEPKRNIVLRLLWLVILFAAAILAIYMSVTILNDWKDQPVVTTIKTTALPINDLDFPAITICNQGFNIKTMYKFPNLMPEKWEPWLNSSTHQGKDLAVLPVEEQMSILTEFVKSSVPNWPGNLTLHQFVQHMTLDHVDLIRNRLLANHQDEDVPSYDILLNPERGEELENEIGSINGQMEGAFKRMNITDPEVNSLMLGALWFSVYPCQEFIRHCKWKGVDVPCQELFNLIPTDRGFCCSFNHDTLDKTLRNSSYVSSLAELDKRFKKLDPSWNSNTPIDMSPNAGQKNGLSIIVDMKPSEKDIPSSVSNDFNGVEVNVGARHTFPRLDTDSFLVAPGKVTMVEITAEKLSTSDGYRDLRVKDRGCYFEDELRLQLFSEYTSDNCWIECLLNLTRKINDNECLPWNMPSPDGHACCNPIEQHDFFNTFDNLDMSKVMGAELCYPDCASTVYSTRVTTAPFRKCDPANMGLSRLCKLSSRGGPVPQKWGDAVLETYKKKSPAGSVPEYISDFVESGQRERGDGSTYDAYEEDMAEVLFFFTKPVTTELLSSPSMTVFDFVASLGGIMGLLMGISFISVIEIAYWFTVKLAEAVLKKKEQSK